MESVPRGLADVDFEASALVALQRAKHRPLSNVTLRNYRRVLRAVHFHVRSHPDVTLGSLLSVVRPSEMHILRRILLVVYKWPLSRFSKAYRPGRHMSSRLTIAELDLIYTLGNADLRAAFALVFSSGCTLWHASCIDVFDERARWWTVRDSGNPPIGYTLLSPLVVRLVRESSLLVPRVARRVALSTDLRMLACSLGLGRQVCWASIRSTYFSLITDCGSSPPTTAAEFPRFWLDMAAEPWPDSPLL